MTRAIFAVAALVAASVLGCYSAQPTARAHADAVTAAKPKPGSLGGALGSPNATPAGSSDASCAEASKIPYVLSDESVLYAFDPPSLSFREIGPVGCGLGPHMTGQAMTVDRQGTAWVSSSDGGLLKVSLADASCERVPNFNASDFGWRSFSLGFASNDTGGPDETLFIAEFTPDPDAPSKGIGALSADLKFAGIGPFTGVVAGLDAELTGTGDGRLFAYFTFTLEDLDSGRLVQIDKKTGATIESLPVPIRSDGEGSVVFWGGDFWLFTSVPLDVGPNGIDLNTPAGSVVSRLHYATDKSQEIVVPSVDFNIMSAAVSTCAPTSPVDVK